VLTLVLGKQTEDDEFGDTLAEQDIKPECSQSPSETMPPPRGTPQFSSPFTSRFFGHSPSYDGMSPNGGTNSLFTMNSPLNAIYSPPRSVGNSPMDLATMLCDPTIPGVHTPPLYDAPWTRDLLKIDAITTSAPPKFVPQVTRTPPPIGVIPPMYREYEFHSSDESEAEEEGDVEELPRASFEDSNDLIPNPKRRRLNSYVPSDTSSLHLPLDELRMWDFYDKMTCSILSCKNAVGENPWRDDLIGRAMQSDALKHALFAMTSFHMKRYSPDEEWAMANYGLNHTNSSFQALRKVMNDGLAFDENNIAAMLVLSFSQVSSSSV